MSEPTRQKQIDDLRMVLDFLESHPDFPMPIQLDGKLYSIVNDKKEFAAAVRMIGSGRKDATTEWFNFAHDFGSVVLEVTGQRTVICERVIVGIEEIETEEADPVAVAAIPKVKVKKQIEVVEWVCPESLLGAAEKAA